MVKTIPQGFTINRTAPDGLIWRRVEPTTPPQVTYGLTEFGRDVGEPLADLFDRYGRYGVVIVDKVGARLLHFQVGQLIDTAGTMGFEVRHIKRGGGTTATGRRGGIDSHAGHQHVEEITAQNMKDVVAETERFCQARSIRHLNLVESLALSRRADAVARRADTAVGAIASLCLSRVLVLLGRTAEAQRVYRLAKAAQFSARSATNSPTSRSVTRQGPAAKRRRRPRSDFQ